MADQATELTRRTGITRGEHVSCIVTPFAAMLVDGGEICSNTKASTRKLYLAGLTGYNDSHAIDLFNV